MNHFRQSAHLSHNQKPLKEATRRSGGGLALTDFHLFGVDSAHTELFQHQLSLRHSFSLKLDMFADHVRRGRGPSPLFSPNYSVINCPNWKGHAQCTTFMMGELVLPLELIRIGPNPAFWVQQRLCLWSERFWC